MKTITLETLENFKYLSDLKVHNHDLYYVETAMDMENNNYKQRLHKYNTLTNEDSIYIDYKKRCTTYLMNDGSFLYADQDPESKTVHTRLTKVENGEFKNSFTLPLQVSNIKDLNEESYLVQATINRSCPEYHHLTLEQQLQVEQAKKDNEDYVVFDEYPFFYNGAGIINGDRNTLFLVNKQTLEITNLIPLTVDVESYDIDGDELVYAGVDFTDVKGLWSWVWKVNLKTLETEVLFDDVLMIGRVFYYNHKVILTGTNGAAVDGKDFYELKDKQLHLLFKNENCLYNSILTDARYGRMKNYYKFNNDSYFIGVEYHTSYIYKFTETGLVKMNDFDGASDDVVVNEHGMWMLGLVDQKLSELYAIVDKKPVQLTHINNVDDYYVATPQRIWLKKDVDIQGWVLLPKDYDENKTYPAILDIHGGPKCTYGEVFYHEMQAWANMGYFVMFCNPRCSDGRGNEFANFMKHYGKTDYEDLMDFVDEVLRLYPAIDAEQLGVAGGSYGGFMCNWIIGHTDRFKAACSQRSISNRIAQICYSDYGIDTPYEFNIYDVDDCFDVFWDISPLKYANNAKTPTLFIHATEDYRCPISEAIQMYTVLKCRGVDTKLVAFIGENHELSRAGKPKHRLRRLNEMTDWLNHYVKKD